MSIPPLADFIEATLLLLVLLNPFLVVVYLMGLVQTQTLHRFGATLFAAGAIASGVFIAFALLGELIFSQVFRADPASFQIFGGVVFLLIGIQFVFHGGVAIANLRGDAEGVAGTIAMPILVGPGTISASVVIGKELPVPWSILSVLIAVGISMAAMVLLKVLHDRVAERNNALVERYVEIAGRITALFVGTVAVQMLMTGLGAWLGIWGVLEPAS